MSPPKSFAASFSSSGVCGTTRTNTEQIFFVRYIFPPRRSITAKISFREYIPRTGQDRCTSMFMPNYRRSLRFPAQQISNCPQATFRCPAHFLRRSLRIETSFPGRIVFRDPGFHTFPRSTSAERMIDGFPIVFAVMGKVHIDFFEASLTVDGTIIRAANFALVHFYSPHKKGGRGTSLKAPRPKRLWMNSLRGLQ